MTVYSNLLSLQMVTAIGFKTTIVFADCLLITKVIELAVEGM